MKGTDNFRFICWNKKEHKLNEAALAKWSTKKDWRTRFKKESTSG